MYNDFSLDFWGRAAHDFCYKATIDLSFDTTTVLLRGTKCKDRIKQSWVHVLYAFYHNTQSNK